MKYITTKLRRVKMLSTTIVLLFLPIRLPLLMLYKLGEYAEQFDENILRRNFNKFENFIVKKFKWDEIATKQYKENPKKFKY